MTTEKSASSHRIIALLFIFLALFILGAGLLYGYESWQLTQNGFAIEGTVVDYQQQMDDDQQMRYAPIIAYRVDGQDYRFVSDNDAYSPAYEIGTTLPILYHLDNPEMARINRPTALWGLPAALVGVGLLLLIASALGMARRGE
jgi:hypothetical protein